MQRTTAFRSARRRNREQNSLLRLLIGAFLVALLALAALSPEWAGGGPW